MTGISAFIHYGCFMVGVCIWLVLFICALEFANTVKMDDLSFDEFAPTRIDEESSLEEILFDALIVDPIKALMFRPARPISDTLRDASPAISQLSTKPAISQETPPDEELTNFVFKISIFRSFLLYHRLRLALMGSLAVGILYAYFFSTLLAIFVFCAYQFKKHVYARIRQWWIPRYFRIKRDHDKMAVLAILRAAGKSEDELKLRAMVGDDGRVVGLDLKDCNRLTALRPEWIEQLSELKQLGLHKCVKMTALPQQIRCLANLETLSLNFCTELTILPPEITELQQLMTLSLTSCTRLKELPIGIGKLGELTNLTLVNCPIVTLPVQIGDLSKLSVLNLDGCEHLVTLPAEIGKLPKELKISLKGCVSLHFPPLNFRSTDKAILFMQDLYLLANEHSSAQDKIHSEHELLFAAAMDPSFASALGKLVKQDRSLADLRDTNGRTALDVACRECSEAMRAALRFFGRYHMEKTPKYSSPTCNVFFAMDNGQEGGIQANLDDGRRVVVEKPVALKFVHEKYHFKAELNARCDAQGEARFSKNYVVGLLRSHDGDENGEFGEAAKQRNLPSYCLVLEQGERSLDEVIRYEDLIGDIVRATPILRDLANCLQHLHDDRGYIHGDFKPKNAIREEITRKWQLIDLDSAVPLESDIGNKLSRAFLPPEMIEKKQGQRPSVRPRKAHESIDVWAFGVVMYLTLTGKSLIESSDVRDDLEEEGLTQLANWSEDTRDEKLDLVRDPRAKELLQSLLHPDWNSRPKMKDVLDQKKYSFFYPTRMAEQLAALQKELQELARQREELQATAKKNAASGRRDQKLEERLGGIEDTLRDLRAALTEEKVAMLRGFLSIEAAKLPSLWIIMKHDRKGRFADFRNRWSLNDKYRLYILCQITGKCAHEPIPLSFLREEAQHELKRALPMIKTTLLLLKIGAFVGRLYGIPLPSELPFLDTVLDGEDGKVRDLGMMVTNLDDLIKQCEALEERVQPDDAGDSVQDWVDTLSRWKERNKKNGLETCAQLRMLLNHGADGKPYGDSRIREISRLQKMVKDDGSCIWVEQSEDTKKKAKNEGYIEAILGPTL